MADHAVQHGIDANSATLLLSFMGRANCVGRVFFGFLLDTFRGHAILLTALVLVANSLSFFLQEFFLSFASQCVLAGVFGLTFGAYSSSTVVVLRTVTEDTTTALGFCFLAFAASSMLGVGTAAALFDKTGDYCLGLLVMALLAGLGAALLGPMASLQGRAQMKSTIDPYVPKLTQMAQIDQLD